MEMYSFRDQCKYKPHCTVQPPHHRTYDIQQVIAGALLEDDAGLGDATCLATIPEEATASAKFLAKADGVLAGLAVADAVFQSCDPGIHIHWNKPDGATVAVGEEFGTVTGNARAVLRAERVALNFMQRMSGIATATSKMVAKCAGTKAQVLETRKTVPGLRLLDKWAVLIGGGTNHRMGLFDMIMIKDNHIAAAGGLRQAVDQACLFVRSNPDRKIPVEVETRTLEEVTQAIECLGNDEDKLITRIMLDNMVRKDESCPGGVDISMLVEAVKMIDGRCETEASGNVTLSTVGAIAQSGCNFISCGALTHSVMALDISFNIDVNI